MGGKGAKERRRLQRLGTGEEGKDSSSSLEQRLDVSNKRSPMSPANQKGRSYPTTRGNHTNTRPGGRHHESQSIPNQQKRRRPGPAAMPRTRTKQQMHPPRKEKKAKKPKHLKRKLEQLGETDTEGREVLLKELSDFEMRKSALAASNPRSGVAHASVKRLHVAASDPVLNQDDITTQPASFPRTTDQKAVPSIPTPNQSTLPPPSSTSQASHESSDSESDVSLAEETKRQRGRRRRGRQETSKKAEETSTGDVEEPTAEHTALPPSAAPPKSTADQASTKSGDKRRCIGRKPVIDFSIGQRYPGKVVYTKPFGVFIDIGCHSDAFCHVSRLRDAFVENVSDVLKEGDEVNPRVVEIDRKAKRITVSLQSDERIEDERNSVEARRERKEKRGSKKSAVAGGAGTTWKRDRQQESIPVETREEPKPGTPVIESQAAVDEANMTPAELKRARKLARRAVRRAQQEETGVAP